MRTVIHVACTGPVIGASLYAFIELTVAISRVFSILHLLSNHIETERFELLESLNDIF